MFTFMGVIIGIGSDVWLRLVKPLIYDKGMPDRRPRSSSKRGTAQEISLAELRALRMVAQCLASGQPLPALVEVVQAVGGINAQLYSALELSLRARITDLTAAGVEASRVEQRQVVRTWCMRGTMHLLAARDLDAF